MLKHIRLDEPANYYENLTILGLENRKGNYTVERVAVDRGPWHPRVVGRPRVSILDLNKR